MLQMGSDSLKNESTPSKEEAATTSEKDKNMIQDKVRILSADASCLNEDLTVEIVELLPVEDIRLNNEDQETTECSSSFGYSQSEDEGQSCEVESELREGNGAMPSAEDVPTIRRKKRALNAEWKAYRQGIEWRCRWLALRVKELQAESSKYDRILALSKKQKEQYLDQQQDGSAARTSTIIGYTHKNRILRRKRRRKAEEVIDLKSYMSKHPVFSRYEKRKQRNQDASGEEATKDENQQLLEIDDFSANFEDEFVDNFSIEEDSVEQYLWHIETMQIRVSKLQEHLTRGYINASKLQPLPVSVAKPTTVTASKAHHGGTSTVRRRNSDFDINNVIMPDNLMANYIEPARHEFIETPQWRTHAMHTSDGSSSSEDTDDEVYNRRHAVMLVKEREHHYAPLLNKNKITSGKGIWKNTASGKERPTGPIGPPALDVIEDFPDFPSTFVFIPKRKRRKRESRDIASLTKNMEPLLNAPNTDTLTEQNEMVKD